jgi:monofunctional glycosyltransferase
MNPGAPVRFWRLFKRGAVVLTAVFGVSLVLGRFLPAPSTLMLGRWLTRQPVAREWRALEAISPHLVRGVVASEDQRFCGHWGVDFDALRDVLDDEGGPSRGASTITMQLVKNLYLWPGRSYLRKALEVPLALAVDLAWGKRRVMEVYLNIAEWGEGIFGAEAAAQAHFGKAARDLTPLEAARLVSILPNPLLRNPGRPSAGSRRIHRRMSGIAPLAACVIIEP